MRMADSLQALQRNSPRMEPTSNQKLHVLAVVSGILPYPSGVCGVPVVTWSVVKTLLERGHRVSVCTFGRSRLDRHRQEAHELLLSQGVAVHDLDGQVPPLPHRSVMANRLHAVRRALAPTPADLYPGIRFAPHLQRMVDQEQPDALYVFDFPAAAVVARLKHRPPGLVALVNLDHVAHAVKRATQPVSTFKERYYRTLNTWAERRLPVLEVAMLKPFERVVDHAAHHADWLRQRGVRQCIYLPNPVVDAIGPQCIRLRREYQAGLSRPKILFIGRLDSIINRPALELLAKEILPVLEAELGTEGFQLDIVGQGELLPEVAARLNRPSVMLRGFVEDVQQEFLSCHVLLVPTPSELGFRTRVAEGFSYGCCLVSHTSNALGMPELVHEDNALLAGNGIGLARQTIRALRDPDLRHRLQHRARETYEAKLDATKVCGRIVTELEVLTRQHATPTRDG